MLIGWMWVVFVCPYYRPIVLRDKELRRRVCRQAHIAFTINKRFTFMDNIEEHLADDLSLKEQRETRKKKTGICIHYSEFEWEFYCAPLYCKPSKHVTLKLVLTLALATSLTDCVEMLNVFAILYVKPSAKATCNQKTVFSVILWAGNNSDERVQLDESLMSFSSIGWIPTRLKRPCL